MIHNQQAFSTEFSERLNETEDSVMSEQDQIPKSIFARQNETLNNPEIVPLLNYTSLF